MDTINSEKITTELYELKMPGQLLGKEVVDNKAKRIGVIRSVRITLPPLKAELIVKGLDVEFPINVEDVLTVGSVIQLKTTIKEAEEVEIHDILRLRKEIWEEIKSYLEG